MKYCYDLHIHSILSPDSDELMTPNNIFNMASIKKLDIIAVTDHNSLKQWPVIHDIAQSYDFLVIPGIEIHVKEDFHVLCYFKSLNDAMIFDRYIHDIHVNQSFTIFKGDGQWITNIHDEPIQRYPYNLLTSINLSIIDLIDALKSYDHLLVYAHLDRKKYSGLKFIHQIPLHAVELTKHASHTFLHEHHLEHHFAFYNSDAHRITDILERGEKNTIELDELTIEAFFERVKHG